MGLHDEVQVGSCPSAGCQHKDHRKERSHKTEDESKSAPDSPKFENKHVHNRRNQYYLHHSGSSSECPTKKSTENLAKDGNEEEQESNNFCASGHNRRSVSNQPSSALPVCPITSDQTLSGSVSIINVTSNLVHAEESDSDLGQNTNSRSRQKKFLKTFKQLPPEEQVLQRYSCALVGDILLQGHLYITHNYFAFYSNVFGYVTRLEIPIRKVTKISKEKTAKIIPNAVGLSTRDEKHIFASLLSRDTTFKLMNRLWNRVMRDLPPEFHIQASLPELPLETELDDEEEFIQDDDDLSTDSEGLNLNTGSMNLLASDPIEKTFGVKQRSQSNNSIYFHSQQCRDATRRNNNQCSIYGGSSEGKDLTQRRSSSIANSTSGRGVLTYMTCSVMLSILVILILVALLCSSLYLVFRVEALQKQVEQRYYGSHKQPQDLDVILGQASTQEVKDALDANVDQITTVRKSLEKLTDMLSSSKKEKSGN